MTAPSVVAFDAIETTFSLQVLGTRLEDVGLGADQLPLWFARTLRDAFAVAATDAYAPFAALRAAGVRVVTLTNGAAETTQILLRNAGLAAYVELTLSTDTVRAFKPRAEVYRYAAAAGVTPDAMALVAAQAWDIHGAKAAGLTAGFVALRQRFPETLRAPDVQAGSLSAVVARLLAL